MTQGNVASQFTTSTAALEPQHETSENVICSWISKPRTPNRRRRPLRRRETRICVYASGSLGVESRLKLATAADTLQRHADIYLPLNWPRLRGRQQNRPSLSVRPSVCFHSVNRLTLFLFASTWVMTTNRRGLEMNQGQGPRSGSGRRAWKDGNWRCSAVGSDRGTFSVSVLNAVCYTLATGTNGPYEFFINHRTPSEGRCSHYTPLVVLCLYLRINYDRAHAAHWAWVF